MSTTDSKILSRYEPRKGSLESIPSIRETTLYIYWRVAISYRDSGRLSGRWRGVFRAKGPPKAPGSRIPGPGWSQSSLGLGIQICYLYPVQDSLWNEIFILVYMWIIVVGALFLFFIIGHLSGSMIAAQVIAYFQIVRCRETIYYSVPRLLPLSPVTVNSPFNHFRTELESNQTSSQLTSDYPSKITRVTAREPQSLRVKLPFLRLH